MGNHTADLIVKSCTASEFADCEIIFSGLDADVAGDIGRTHLLLNGGIADWVMLQKWSF